MPAPLVFTLKYVKICTKTLLVLSPLQTFLGTLLSYFKIKAKREFLSVRKCSVPGIHISSRQVVRDDYKVLRTSIKNHKLVRWTSKF